VKVAVNQTGLSGSCDATIRENVRMAQPGATDDELTAAPARARPAPLTCQG